MGSGNNFLAALAIQAGRVRTYATSLIWVHQTYQNQVMSNVKIVLTQSNVRTDPVRSASHFNAVPRSGWLLSYDTNKTDFPDWFHEN